MGTTNFDAVSLSGNFSVTGSLSVTGAVTLASTLAVTGASTLTGALTANGGVTVKAGTGTGTIKPAGILSMQSSQVATAANTNETDAHSYTLPGNTLAVDGQAVEVTIYGTTAANGNNKTVQFYFGGTSIYTTGAVAANAKPFVMTMLIVRGSASTQRIHIGGNFNGAPVTGTTIVTNAAKDLTGDLVIKSTMTNGSSSASDCTIQATVVKLLP